MSLTCATTTQNKNNYSNKHANMFNQVTYNVVIERFKAFAAGHYKIERFSHGQIDVTDIDKEQRFPWMHVVPVSIQPSSGSRSFTFDVVFADMPRDKENKTEYQRESLSDCIQLAEDLLAEIKNGTVIFGEDVTLEEGSAVQPFMEEYTHVLTGVTLSLTMTFPWNWSACDIPADWSTGGSSGGGSGGGSVTSLVLKVNNVDNAIQNILNLTNGTNTTIVDLGDGRVQINSSGGVSSVSWGDIIGNIADQLDLAQWFNEKADVSSLAEVAFTGDYNDLINTPTLATVATTGDYNDLINTPTLATVATTGDYNDLINLPTLPPVVGDMTKAVYDTDDDGVVDKAERIEIVVRNSTGSTLLKGQIVFLSGSTGNRPNAILASATTEATSSKTIGFVVADIADNADGNVAVNGTLHDLDTSAFSAGDTLWLSETDGAWEANTPPAEPAHAVFLGYVARSHPNIGRVVIQIQNGYELNELHGVKLTTPTDGNFLVYDSGQWKNRSLYASDIPSGIDATNIGTGVVSNTEFSYLDGVTGAVQPQLNLLTAQVGSRVASNPAIVGATNTKITYDSKGLVTSGTSLVAADLPSHTHTVSQISNASTLGTSFMQTTAGAGDFSYPRINPSGASVSNISASSLATDVNNKIHLFYKPPTSPTTQTSTLATASAITNLSASIEASKWYTLKLVVGMGCNNTGGVRLQFAWSGAGMSVFSGGYHGYLTTNSAQRYEWLNFGNAVLFPATTTYFNAVNAQVGFVVVEAVLFSTVADTITVGFAAGTAGQTATIYNLPTYLLLTRIS